MSFWHFRKCCYPIFGQLVKNSFLWLFGGHFWVSEIVDNIFILFVGSLWSFVFLVIWFPKVIIFLKIELFYFLGVIFDFLKFLKMFLSNFLAPFKVLFSKLFNFLRLFFSWKLSFFDFLGVIFDFLKLLKMFYPIVWLLLKFCFLSYLIF